MTLEEKLPKTYHIIFDVIGAKSELLRNEDFVFHLLLDVPKIVNMKVLAGPSLVRDYDKTNLGISGFAIISFSHISIHTFSSTGVALVDIFSCKPFDKEKVRKYLFEKFQVKDEDVCTMEVLYPWEQAKTAKEISGE